MLSSCSLPRLLSPPCALLLFRLTNPVLRIAPFAVSCFFYSSPYSSYFLTASASVPFVFLSTLFLCHLLSLTYLFDLFPFSLPTNSFYISALRLLQFSLLDFLLYFANEFFSPPSDNLFQFLVPLLRCARSSGNAFFKQSSGRSLFASLLLVICIVENSKAASVHLRLNKKICLGYRLREGNPSINRVLFARSESRQSVVENT